MNGSMNLHRVRRVTITPGQREGCRWTSLTIESADGSKFSIALHLAGDGPVEIILLEAEKADA